MSWQRFNTTSNVFEVSENNGASWTPLVIAAGGLPAGLAYQTQVNTFNQYQYINTGSGGAAGDATLFLSQTNPSYPLCRFRLLAYTSSFKIWNGDTNAELFSLGIGGGLTVAGTVTAGTFYASGVSNSFGDFTCRGATNFAGGLYVTAGNVTIVPTIVCNAITANTSIQSGSYMYPGAITNPNVIQGTWYLGAHSSYGLYTNTGMYLESAIWPYYIEARAHIRAAGDLYAGGTTYTPSISFPAAQVSNAGVNVLDDYEEGAWTPVAYASSLNPVTHSIQVGYYTKIGRYVHCVGRVGINSWGGSSGSAGFAGLPFVIAANTYPIVRMGYSGVGTAMVGMQGYGALNGTYAWFIMKTAATTDWYTPVQCNIIGNVFDVMFCIDYATSS